MKLTIYSLFFQLSVNLDQSQTPPTQQSAYPVTLGTTVQSTHQIHVKCVPTISPQQLQEVQASLSATVSFFSNT